MEQVNQEVEMYLQMFCQGQSDKWSELIPMAEFVHNSATHLSMQKSPFSLILGYELRDYPRIGQTFFPSLEDRLTLLEQPRDEALAAHQKAQQSMKERITTKFVLWKVGNKVWLEGKNRCLHLPPTWRIHDVFHASLLLTYQDTAEHWPNFVNPPLEEIDSEEEYEVAKILSHRGSPGRWSYLVSWKGYSSAENTWEPEKNLQHTQTILSMYKQ